MAEPFKIYIDRLRKGEIQKIDDRLAPSFLGPEEKDLRFPAKVEVKGEAYLTDDHLILKLKARTGVEVPCAVCNEMTKADLRIDDFYHAEPIQEIRDAVFDFAENLREALLIELPQYLECNQGKCPGRAAITPYLRSQKQSENPTHFPFSGLDDLT